MSQEKDGLQSIKVYRFNNTKESWHEFALKFGVIADYRGYSDIIEGIVTPPDDETSGNANEMDDKTPTMPMHTTTMAKQLTKPVGELRLGADDDALTLATQEKPPTKLVYITNMPECTLETSENV